MFLRVSPLSMLHQGIRKSSQEAPVLYLNQPLTHIVAHRTPLRFPYLPNHETSRVAISWHCRAYFIYPTTLFNVSYFLAPPIIHTYPPPTHSNPSHAIFWKPLTPLLSRSSVESCATPFPISLLAAFSYNIIRVLPHSPLI